MALGCVYHATGDECIGVRYNSPYCPLVCFAGNKRYPQIRQVVNYFLNGVYFDFDMLVDNSHRYLILSFQCRARIFVQRHLVSQIPTNDQSNIPVVLAEYFCHS